MSESEQHWTVGAAEEFVERQWMEGLGWNEEKDCPMREPDPQKAAEEVMSLPTKAQAAFVGNVILEYCELNDCTKRGRPLGFCGSVGGALR